MINEQKQLLFSEIMDELFDTENKKTLEYYCEEGFDEIPQKQMGLYTIIKPDDFNINIFEEIPAPKKYGEKSCILKTPDKQRLKSDGKYLYIGQSNDIRKRIGEYINFGFTKCSHVFVNHEGGYPIWFIENNEKLMLDYITIDEIHNKFYDKYKGMIDMHSQYHYGVTIAGFFEAGLLELHNLAYNQLPFANTKYENAQGSWREFWNNCRQ